MGCFSWCLLNHRIDILKKIKHTSFNLSLSPHPPEHGEETTVTKEIEKRIPAQHLAFRDLTAIAGNFSPSYLIGEGGFGKVYIGCLSGQNVAIKCLNHQGQQGHAEFLMEVLMLSHLRHVNLVNLVGYCTEGDQRLLVYEFMPNRSLDLHLFNKDPTRVPLDWNTRMRIALGVARGLKYLHCEAKPPVIFRDMKASNILLDKDFSPKLSDFGLAKVGPVGRCTHVSTRVMGTHGYCAPDYFETGKLTMKSDIYSFGVVLLELITGRMAHDSSKGQKERDLVIWARPLIKYKKMMELADPVLKGCFGEEYLMRAVFIAEKCIKGEGCERPDIGYVVEALEHVAKGSDKWKERRGN